MTSMYRTLRLLCLARRGVHMLLRQKCSICYALLPVPLRDSQHCAYESTAVLGRWTTPILRNYAVPSGGAPM